MESKIFEVKKKKIFSGLPNSIIQRALELNKNDVGQTRAFLRKYFGVFLTNKVVKPKNIEDYDGLLKSHISSKKRDYLYFYERIHSSVGDDLRTIIDLGCGVNGFSYSYVQRFFPEASYLGVESSEQIIKNTQEYFKKRNFSSAKIIQKDLFEIDEIKKLISVSKCPKIIFLLQVVDALESLENNFSKKLLLNIKSVLSEKDFILLSFSTKSISGRKTFFSSRTWIREFLEKEFTLIEEFEIFEELFFLVKK